MRSIFVLIVIIALFGCGTSDKKKAEETAVTSINGEQLFKDNCASCHKCDVDFTGPALKGALQRWSGDKPLMYEFVRSSWTVIQKNEYAKNLQQRYNGNVMTPFTLTDKEIDAIFDYCNNTGPAVSGK
jgi:mono/diheme cytochrome c family protein